MGITSSTEQKTNAEPQQQQQRGRSSSTSNTTSPTTTSQSVNINKQQQQHQQSQNYKHSQSYTPVSTVSSASSSNSQAYKQQQQQQQQQQRPQSSYQSQSPYQHSQSYNSGSNRQSPLDLSPQQQSQSSSSKQHYGQSVPNHTGRYIPGSTPATSEFNVLMSPPSSPLSGSLGIPNAQEAVPTVFTWAGGGREVFIAGSFNNWKEKIPLSHSEKDFTLIYNLPPGVHQYKFIVDGKWVHSSDQPVAADTKGNLINFVEVKSKDISSDLSNFKISSTPPGSYSKTIPTEDFQKFPPPSLPPHLRRALLNTQPSTEDPTLLPLPHHVMLNHLYSLPRKDKVTILGVTNRYKTKFVTTVLYKPVHESSNDKEEPDDLN
ncbi:putative glycoside hydrolase [Heterostelium album PN500]|uniref:Putative glycoside hydrolase n=1 Tax=Heterostelium pallidum (strain ATCC 26659 / Pp 5 / PN500) TaxID=670386 RepID=D3AW03_HETP5|nr:putative glycoside hydrolase [Heterostelium album PN500]EFA86476.1 putative glycoside hydrolase [Heterostelium album PN500]|eukprot:XP_020438581.1 putative glycoside hydrolase [Heterostelium album PN500]